MKQEKQLRILFTSVGRRVELMQSFRRAAEEKNIDLKIYGADITRDAPALFYCDEKRKVCKIREPQYIPQLLQICREDRIDLLIPTIDTDLLLLSQNKSKFEQLGTKVFISAEDKIALCRDKRYTADFYISCGVDSPKPVDKVEDYQGGFPAFIKPKDGSSSINAYRADTKEELLAFSEKVPGYIIQPFIDGREYTVDILCDFEGNPIYVTPRERLAVRSGEVLKTKITQDDKMIEESLHVIKGFCPCGPITLQLIREKNTGNDSFIEINPRFGGGAPLSMMAGADAARATLMLLLGEKIPYQEKAAGDGLIYSRFDQCVCIREEEQQNMAYQASIGIPEKEPQKKEQEKIIHPASSGLPNAQNRVSSSTHRFLYTPQSLSNTQNGVSGIIKSLLEADIYVSDIEAVILDLDDTLYNEIDYIKSGYRKIAEKYPNIPEAEQELWQYFKERKPAIDLFLKKHGLEADKEACLSCYRSQMPELILSEEHKNLLKKWRAEGKKLGIITDGRPEGQRNKIQALGLEELVDEIIITDELAGKNGDVRKFRKPAKPAFEIMQLRMEVPYEKMVYIGDNPSKDFFAPQELSMKTLWLQNEQGVYYHSADRDSAG
jgi:carbamoyl-phosphate synthase large subunit